MTLVRILTVRVEAALFFRSSSPLSMVPARWFRRSAALIALVMTGLSAAQATPRSALSSPAPDTTALGVVWTPPAQPDSALRELARIDALGATAVRLMRLPTDTVAARADSLGLDLYVDLPVAHVSARQLPDTLAQAAPTWERLQALARRHPSITHVGLARIADTTVPSACETLRRWTDRVHAGAAALRTYYVTPFSAAADQCAEAVDRPLLDVRNHPAPAERWHQWRAHSASAGIGAVGTWVDPAAESGLRVPRSPERQARYLEGALSPLLDSTRRSPSVLFVFRWQDRPLLSSRRYGVHASDGTARPGARVVEGVYTGTQDVFAFPTGTAPAAGSYGLVLLGWGLVALLGVLYARSLFVRRTVARYFTAPGFYRDALRDGRDLAPGTNGLLLGTVAGALGIAAVCVARQGAAHPGTDRVLAALPHAVRGAVAGGIEHPVWAGVAVGGTALGLLGLWMGALVLAARGWTRLSVAQGLVLIVWPSWPALLILPVALATGPEAPVSPPLFALLLLGGGSLALVYKTGRVLFDYWSITGVPGWVLVPLSLLSPFALASATVLVLAMRYGVSFAFLWHLATRT